jgi:hypothetical protein
MSEAWLDSRPPSPAINPKWLNFSSDTQEAILAEPPLRR